MKCSTSLASPGKCARVGFCAAAILLFMSAPAIADDPCPDNVAGGGPYYKSAPSTYGVATGINLTAGDRIALEIGGVPTEVPTSSVSPTQLNYLIPAKSLAAGGTLNGRLLHAGCPDKSFSVAINTAAFPGHLGLPDSPRLPGHFPVLAPPAARFDFSQAYASFDREPGDVDLTEVPVSFQIGLSDELELFFNIDAYRGIGRQRVQNLCATFGRCPGRAGGAVGAGGIPASQSDSLLSRFGHWLPLPAPVEDTGASAAIDLQTGNFVFTMQALSAPSVSGTFGFTFSINSMAGLASNPVGNIGLRSSTNATEWLIGNSNRVSDWKADGRQTPFVYAGGIDYTGAQAGILDKLQRAPGGALVLTTRDQTKRVFGSDGHPIYTQYPAPPDTAAGGGPIRQTYTYAANSDLANVTDEATGRTLTFTTDSSHRFTTIEDSARRAVHFTYTAAGFLDTFTDAQAAVWKFAYDSGGRITGITDPRANTTTLTYDSSNRVASAANPLGAVTRIAYDSPSAGMTTVTDARGNQTRFVYDEERRLASITLPGPVTYSMTYSETNQVASYTDPLGNVSAATYDENGNALTLTDPLGHTETHTSDTANRLLIRTDRNGNTATFIYAGVYLTSATDPAGAASTYTYTIGGRLLSATDKVGNVTSYSYNAAGDLASIVEAAGTAVERSAQFEYDAAGRMTRFTDSTGVSTEYSWNALNRLLSVTEAAATQLQRTTTAAYDAAGNLVSLTDPLRLITQYTYDNANRLTSKIEASGTSDQRTTRYAYDAKGNLTGITDPRGGATAFAYDGLDRVTRKTDPLGNFAGLAYDNRGNITAITDANGNTSRFEYDELNRLVRELPFAGGPILHAYDPAGNEIELTDARGLNKYGYDPLYRMASAATADGNTLAYTYDAAGRLAQVTLPEGRTYSYSYDALNRLVSADDGAGNTTTYTYETRNRPASIARPNGVSTEYVYDALGRMTSVTHKNGAAMIAASAYEYDADDNRTRSTDKSAVATQYRYDRFNRLISQTVGSQVTSYTYDANGNRLTAGSSTFVYDAANRMTRMDSTTLASDKNGNLTNDGAKTYTYDAYNRLTGITAGNSTFTYRYDGHGRRISQSTGAGTYQYVVDPVSGAPLTETGPDGSLTYFRGLGLISAARADTVFYHQTDGTGDVIAVTDAAGAVRQSYAYDSWGKLVSTPDTLGDQNKYKALGAYTDPGTGLLHLYNGIYYNPLLGRTFSGGAIAGFPDAYVFRQDNPLR